MKNIITKAVGAKQNIDLTVLEETLEVGDLYLLCTDGLHGMLTHAEMVAILNAKKANLEETIQALVAAANENGGKDNITAVALRYSK